MTHRPAAVAAIAAAALIASAAPAAATLPKPKTTKIVNGKSMGGVRIGMTLAQAQAAWGPGGLSEAGDACRGDGSRTSCIWKGRSSRERGLVSFDQLGAIDGITISGGPSSPLATWRAARRFGIGTTSTALFKALGLGAGFPVGLGAPPGSTAVYVDRRTAFFLGRSKRVIAVRIGEL